MANRLDSKEDFKQFAFLWTEFDIVHSAHARYEGVCVFIDLFFRVCSFFFFGSTIDEIVFPAMNNFFPGVTEEANEQHGHDAKNYKSINKLLKKLYPGVRDAVKRRAHAPDANTTPLGEPKLPTRSEADQLQSLIGVIKKK